MKAILNKTQLRYCDICDKVIIISSKSKQINSKIQKHKEEYGIVVEEDEIFNPEVHELDYILDNVLKDCRDNFFQTFEYRSVYDINFTKVSSSKEVFLTVTHGDRFFKSEFYGSEKKIEIEQKIGFVFNQIVNLTINFDSSLSYVNICLY